MSQYNFGNLESPLAGTVFFNTHLEPWRDALHSQHSGTSRPSYAISGMLWLNTTTNPWVLNMFDGTDDIALGTFNTSTNIFTPSNVQTDWCGSAGGTANAITLTPSIVRTSYGTGDAFEFLITTTNTAEAVTANVSSLGNKNIKAFIGVGKVNPAIGALQAGMVARAVYDGTDIVVLNIRAYNPSSNVATASTLNLDTVTGDYVALTGTTTVTAITLANGQERTCKAGGAFTLTNGASLICPTGANIAVAAGDVFIVRGEPSGVVRVVSYMRASGLPVGIGSSILQKKTFTTATQQGPSTTSIPEDNSIPQSGEGLEVFSQSFTPLSATSKIVISGYINLFQTSGQTAATALFVDAGAGAVAVNVSGGGVSGFGQGVHFRFVVDASNTSARTYKIRAGTASGTFYINRSGTANLYGSLLISSMTIEEVSV